jgi:hypothetical protein
MQGQLLMEQIRSPQIIKQSQAANSNLIGGAAATNLFIPSATTNSGFNQDGTYYK